MRAGVAVVLASCFAATAHAFCYAPRLPVAQTARRPRLCRVTASADAVLDEQFSVMQFPMQVRLLTGLRLPACAIILPHLTIHAPRYSHRARFPQRMWFDTFFPACSTMTCQRRMRDSGGEELSNATPLRALF